MNETYTNDEFDRFDNGGNVLISDGCLGRQVRICIDGGIQFAVVQNRRDGLNGRDLGGEVNAVVSVIGVDRFHDQLANLRDLFTH